MHTKAVIKVRSRCVIYVDVSCTVPETITVTLKLYALCNDGLIDQLLADNCLYFTAIT